MSDDPTPSVSIIQDNITNESSELHLEGLQPDSPIVSESTDTSLSDSYLIFENIEDSKSDLALVSEYAEQNSNSLSFDNFAEGSIRRKKINSDSEHETQLDLLDINSDNYEDETDDSINITTEVMVAIYKEITINIVASTLLKKFSDSINYSFRVFDNSITSGRTLTKYLQTLNFIASCDYFSNSNSIFVTSAIERVGIICIEDEKFGSVSSRLDSNLYIIAAFVDEKKTKAGKERKIYYWPGKVLYYFKHRVQVSKEVTTENSRNQIDFKTIEHSFAFVDWYKTSNCCDHFHIYSHETDCFQFDESGRAHAGMFCAKLWENSFYKHSVENVLPVQRIFC
ncbi:17783_t:CDS:2 [Cetraspora pellucida]|uniref:17783_t:CDS:1 n=1 Tax=Cetraspora pellucida TaxID=1433469 RepID=A0A9N9A9H5_9GLOM|nr:17783_t:CDS:2 [Cetraspora pellucida]